MSIKLCGIDEAGRGPLAGPLVVAGVVLNSPVDGLGDSKKLSEKKRKLLYEEIIKFSSYHYCSWTASQIDEFGLSFCIKNSLLSIKSVICADRYIFDGNTRFGVKDIEVLVKADMLINEVMAASIVAKTIRDKLLMVDAEKYTQFDFASHKGYGTAKHICEIKDNGLTEIHRKSYCKKIIC